MSLLSEALERGRRSERALARDRLTVRNFGDAILGAVDTAALQRSALSVTPMQRLILRHSAEIVLVDVAAFRTVARRRGALAEQWLRELALERLS